MPVAQSQLLDEEDNTTDSNAEVNGTKSSSLNEDIGNNICLDQSKVRSICHRIDFVEFLIVIFKISMQKLNELSR